MRVVLLVEGKTARALKEALKVFLDERAAREGQPRVRLTPKRLDTGLLSPERVRDQVALSLRDPDVACVAGLIDVYPNFRSAQEAKDHLRRAAGGEARFHAHAAQYEVEAWLLPYWEDICRKLSREMRVRRQPPGASPERVDRERPPSHHLAELYRQAGRSYDKPRDARAILEGKDLTIAASQCPELKSFLNTLLTCAGLTPLP